jgi:hypothetical protein
MCATERAFQLLKTETCLEPYLEAFEGGHTIALTLSEVRLKRSVLSAQH